MSEVLGTFELEHVCNTYTTDSENNITNHTNWRGSADGYGSIWGTLTFAPTPLGSMTEKLGGGEVRWTGQGFLEDGTSVTGTGAGTWRKDPNGHIWHTDYILDISDGTKIHSVNNKIQIGSGNEDEIIRFNADGILFETPVDETFCVQTYNNTLAAKQSVTNNDQVLGIDSWGYNGTEYARAGLIGIQVDGTPNPSGTSIPSSFRVILSNETSTFVTNADNGLMFTNKGVLEVPVFKAKGTNFANRDSMTAEPGMIIFNTSNNTFQGFNGTSWVDLG